LSESVLKKNTVAVMLKSSYYMLRLGLSLFYTWLILRPKVRKTRKSFERQLITVGMSSEDAERISRVFLELKDQMLAFVKSSVAGSKKA